MARIIVIDDDDLVRRMITSVLVKAGHDVEGAENGFIGLDKIKKAPPHVVVTDILMPDKEGIETIMELRSDYPDVKIIAMSGGGNTGDMGFLQMAKKIGADHILKKPFKPSELIATIDGMMCKEG